MPALFTFADNGDECLAEVQLKLRVSVTSRAVSKPFVPSVAHIFYILPEPLGFCRAHGGKHCTSTVRSLLHFRALSCTDTGKAKTLESRVDKGFSLIMQGLAMGSKTA
jgi:hypothetical protein